MDGPTAADLRDWRIERRGPGPVFDHCVAEMRAHLGTGSEGASGAGALVLEAGDGGADGYTATVSADQVLLRGDNPRGLVNAVAWTLEQLGFGWVEPGDSGRAFRNGLVLRPGQYREQPQFPTRTLILGQDALHDDWRAWLEWASRNRLNDVFFHDTPPSRLGRTESRPATAGELAADGGGWLFERWDADGPAIVAAARERGMTIQFGGHHLPGLVPRRHFELHPEWFPLRGGQRDPRYNLCVSSAGALDCLRAGAREFVAAYPGADVYHFWADDIRGGGWCECPGCAALTASDQALIATNAVAEALTGRRVRVAHLAYHDTVAPPASVRPAEGVLLLWAPRERCYAHGIADPACEKNREEYWKPFTGLLEAFGTDSGRIQTFEYYSDAILFKGVGPTHLGVLQADARAYAGAGVSNLQDLMVGDRPWIGAPWHAWWFARCAWDPARDATAALEQYCALAFAGAPAEYAAISRRAEAAYLKLLDLDDLEMIARHDVLDFSAQPRETLRTKAREAVEAAAELDACAYETLRLASTTWETHARPLREAAQATFVAAIAGHLAARTAAWDAALDGEADRARGLLETARERLAAVEAWDAEWNTPAYAVITSGMRRAMHYHIRRVEALLA